MKTRHGVSLAAIAIATATLAAACSAGGGAGGGGGATVFGRVQDEAGTGIDGAQVTLGSDVDDTGATGGFTFDTATGWMALEVVAAGYRSISTEIKLASGDNSIEIIMVTCTPGVDVPCATPTPTPTTPTPTPTPNVIATFVGVNGNPDPVNPANSAFGTWTGSAVLTRAGGGTLNLGNDGDMSDLAFPECWLDAAETNDWDGAGTPDHCVFWWEGEDEGAIVNAGLNDAIFYVSIPGAEFTAGNTVTFADGMTAGYYEGDFTVDGFRIADYGAPARAATEGTLTLGNVGMNDGQNVSIAGQATFYIPNLP